MIEFQIEEFKQFLPEATITKLPSGAYLVIAPAVSLPSGWSKTETSIRFFLPVGYPAAKPDCFWADEDLTLVGGGQPTNSQIQHVAEIGGTFRWFSWHAANWNASRDSIRTYYHTVYQRFRDAR